MKFYFKLFLLSTALLWLTACSQGAMAPHTAIKCKVNYDTCMVANTFEGPLRSHKICLAERLPVCYDLPTP